jgi:parvulin-like peptidyl-prolyl isomerase
LAGLLVLIILLVGVCVIGLYRFNFNHDLAIRVAKTLQLPAGKINNQYISLGDYLDNIKKLSSAINQKREGIYLYSDSTQIADQILYRLAAEKIMEDELSKRGIKFDASLVKTQMNSLIQQAGGEDSATKMVSDLYGLNLNDFKDKILRPLTLRDQFQNIVMQDESIGINQTAKQKADQVLALALSSSSDFSVLAKEYTNDESGVNTGGDLGWVIKEQIKEDWRDLIFNQADETVIPQLLKSVYGYHIVKVEKKLIDESSGTESVKLRHILISVNIDDYIKELLDSSTLVKYTK